MEGQCPMGTMEIGSTRSSILRQMVVEWDGWPGTILWQDTQKCTMQTSRMMCVWHWCDKAHLGTFAHLHRRNGKWFQDRVQISQMWALTHTHPRSLSGGLKLHNLLFATLFISPRFYNILASPHPHTHIHDACDPFVIITPRFYNIVASPHRTHTYIRRMRSVCNPKILQHHQITNIYAHAIRL